MPLHESPKLQKIKEIPSTNGLHDSQKHQSKTFESPPTNATMASIHKIRLIITSRALKIQKLSSGETSLATIYS